MDTRLPIALLCLSLATGCSLGSTRGDLDRIVALTRAEHASSLPEDLFEGDFAEPSLGAAPGLSAEAELDTFLAEPLTAELALRQALRGNRTLRAEIRELGIERGLLLQASMLPNPSAEFDLRLPDDSAQPLQVDFGVSMPLTESLLVPLRAAAASRDLDAARYRVAASVLRMVYAVRAAYYRARGAERRWRIATRALEALAAARDAARMLQEAGGVPAIDAATQIAFYEEARLAVAALELERAQRREALQRLLGLSGPATEWQIALTVEPLPSEGVGGEIEREVISASLELAELRMQADAAGARIDLSQLEGWLPDVSVDVHGEADGPGWEVGGGASFTLPLFNRGEGRTAMYTAELAGLVERYEALAIDLRSSARVTVATLEAARLRARHYEDVVLPSWARAVEETLLQYNAMQLSVFELVAALRARLAAEQEAARAQEDYWVARAALDALLAGAQVEAPMAASDPSPSMSLAGGH